MNNKDLALAFFESLLGPLARVAPVTLTGRQYVQAVWPLNEVFSPHFHRIQSVRYRPKFESRADAAIEAFARDPQAAAWADLPAGTWRVLLERHQQMLQVALTQEGAGNASFTSIPSRLPQRYVLPGLMLLWLHSMRLPWPPADQSLLELPEGDPPASLRPH